MEDRETARMRKCGESKTTRIMMATVPHVTSGLGLRKFQADGFLLTRVYIRQKTYVGKAATASAPDLQNIKKCLETIRTCHTSRNTLQIVVILLLPLTKYFSALNNENGGYMYKTDRTILRDHLHSKLTWLCITLVANIISGYRKSAKCSDYIFFKSGNEIIHSQKSSRISFVRSANLTTISVFPPGMHDIHRRTVEAICRDKNTNNISFESN